MCYCAVTVGTGDTVGVGEIAVGVGERLALVGTVAEGEGIPLVDPVGTGEPAGLGEALLDPDGPAVEAEAEGAASLTLRIGPLNALGGKYARAAWGAAGSVGEQACAAAAKACARA